jgi:ribose 5-phosphate isomerase A
MDVQFNRTSTDREKMNQEDLKKAVAKAAVAALPRGQIIGVGTGSTANHFIDALAVIKHDVAGTVASSEATRARLQALGFAVLDSNAVTHLAVYVDGADEIDPRGHMIKGGGAALTREKIVADLADKFVCIVDASKCVSTLGRFPLPVEVIPMASNQIMRRFAQMGGKAQLRSKDGKTVVTDNGNHIIDVHGLAITEPVRTEEWINQWPGVVTVGLFARRKADVALVGDADGVRTLHYA